MGKLTISMAIFNSYVKIPEGIPFHYMGFQWASDITMAFFWPPKGLKAVAAMRRCCQPLGLCFSLALRNRGVPEMCRNLDFLGLIMNGMYK